MMKNTSLLLILALCLVAIVVPVSAGSASLLWTKNLGYCVTTIDTDISGGLVLAGLGNGSIFAYNSNGTFLWANATNSTATNPAIKKIVADRNGNVAWISEANESGYIAASGTVASINRGTGRNITDVAISDDGSLYAISELYPARITIYYSNGAVYAQNTSFNGAQWTGIGFDPQKAWLVSSNQSDNTLYFWNVSGWAGWEDFNPTHTAIKNASQAFIDTFPYRINISVNNDVNDKQIWFWNVTNVTTIAKVDDHTYFANFLNTGKFFYWTLPGNLSEPQIGLINLSNAVAADSFVVLRGGHQNYTVYFGNKSYNNQIFNQSWTNSGTPIRVNLTSSGVWTAPTGVYAVNITMYGGGGGGAAGPTGSPVAKGQGGNASTVTSYANIAVTPGTSYPITIGDGGTSGINGGTTVFNGTQVANGGLHGSGQTATGLGDNGNISITGYPTAVTGADGADSPIGICGGVWTPVVTHGGNGGAGFGSGGGGGAGDSVACPGLTHTGLGGKGAAGVIQLSYLVNNVAVYYYGAYPSPSYIYPLQNEQSAISLNQSSSIGYVGSIAGMSVPNTGGLVSLITDTIFYQQYLSSTGFGLTYCATLSTGGPALFAGTPHSISSSDAGTASIEGRGAYGNVYDAGGVARASSLTGGTIRSADSSMVSGLFAAFGGDEGKIYMLSREGSTQWYSYYTGAVDTPINAVAVSWYGDVVVDGRFGGTIDYYGTNVTVPVTPTQSYVDASVHIYKDGADYTNQLVTIYSSPSGPYTWTPIATSYTDGTGKLTYSTSVGTYYKFVVNNIAGTQSGEGEAIWQSNPTTTLVQVYVLSVSTPYEWNAVYVKDTHNVSVVYTDTIAPSSVIVTIKDLKTNLNVFTRTYNNQKSFTVDYHDTLQNGSYQVNIVLTRQGMTVRDQRMVASSDNYALLLPVDSYILWGISTLVLMLIAGMFSYTNSKRGALVVVVLATLFMVFGLLPWSLITVTMLAALFAVMSLFGGVGSK